MTGRDNGKGGTGGPTVTGAVCVLPHTTLYVCGGVWWWCAAMAGRPSVRDLIDVDRVAFYRRANYGWGDIATALGVSVSALYAWRKENPVEDILKGANLRAAVVDLNERDPNPYRGIRTTQAYFAARGVKATRADVANALKELYPQAVENRKRRVIYRRTYISPGYGHCWHVDSWHKGHQYGIVVTGGVDGYSKFITYLGVADNNRAKTHLKAFVGTCYTYGQPFYVVWLLTLRAFFSPSHRRYQGKWRPPPRMGRHGGGKCSRARFHGAPS